MVKYCQNKVKSHLVVEKDRGNTLKKNHEKKNSAVFLAIFFRGLRFYIADCTYTVNSALFIRNLVLTVVLIHHIQFIHTYVSCVVNSVCFVYC
jgi:hypothetical protein